MENKKEILGQYFTKEDIINELIELLLYYKLIDSNAKILEPSFGTGNFIKVLKHKGFNSIIGCEIDSTLTDVPMNFFDFPLSNKFDLIIGNPPFSKYNVPESFFVNNNLFGKDLSVLDYLPEIEIKKIKIKIENAFLYKSIKHILDPCNSTIAFVLPISFFIKNKNKVLKNELVRNFKSIIIYQNTKPWFDYHIPCCFAIFTNSNLLKEKIVLIYDNSIKHEFEFDLSFINEELIPEVVYNKTKGIIYNKNGILLDIYLDAKPVKTKKSFTEYNVSAKNILAKTTIPIDDNIDDYKLAVVRVGNSSIGKSGFINIKNDVLNEMFFIFDFKEKYKKNKDLKEKICNSINNNLVYFRKITSRVGSKSIKKEDVLNFRM